MMPDRGRATVEFNVPATMRDGTVLYADVYVPGGGGPFPTLLNRTPYDKAGRTATRFSSLDALAATARGYAVVMQDVRGRHASGGAFNPFFHEADDGYDTTEWIAAQPWSSGKVGMFGRSYVGATQWLAASARPPHLTAIFPGVTASDYHEGWAYQGGAFELGFNLSWTLAALTLRNGDNLRRRLGLGDGDFDAMVDAVDATDEAFRTLPLREQHLLPRRLAPYYYEWLAHPEDDDYWRGIRIEDAYGRIETPALNLGGWYDIFLLGTIRNFLGLRARGGSDAARRGTKLLIGPWSHSAVGQSQVGAVAFGTRASITCLNLDDLAFRWYDHWLKGDQNGIQDEPPIRIFVMGENVWRNENEWPLARAARTRFYLHSGGRANTRRGDGLLSTTPPSSERPDVFLYDPLDPVPTTGGPLCCSATFLPAGPMDHGPLEDRADVLVYSTPPLEQDVEVTGPITVALWAASSAVDTDFTGKLLDVGPCGCARNLADGIIRARYRDSTAAPRPLAPGAPARFEINLVATSNVFKKGHRIRLEVSSSNFPRFDRNLNTGKGFDSSSVVVATNTVFHDSARPSFVSLDIVPRP